MLTGVQGKSKSLLGVGDLTLMAPIKQGLIPAVDARSYESRLRLLMRTLNTLRVSSREAERTPLIADAIDRIRTIHSFRLAIVGQGQKQLLLAVSFDGGWETYMRRIWRDLGPLLDVIFCNCESYPTAHDHPFEAYAAWVRTAQVESEFFYNARPLTVNDLHYLCETQRLETGCPKTPPEPDPRRLLAQALPALSALYRLSDMYPPQHPDGGCLLRAAADLLPRLKALLRGASPSTEGLPATPKAALRWFADAACRKPHWPENVPWDKRKVQGGIVEPYPDITHGCLLLLELPDATAAHALIEHLAPRIISAADQENATSRLFVNLGFTAQGLQTAGLSDALIQQLPQEFLEGMAARAGILGDFLYNHPTRWSLPQRNWPEPIPGEPDRVELSSVHAVVEFVCRGTASTEWQDIAGNPRHPLARVVCRFEQALQPKGVRILSVQALQRFIRKSETRPRDHFGFVDGISQPTLGADLRSRPTWDRTWLGDLLLGYENSLGDPPLSGRLWNDSTFLVIRKLRQDVAALDALVGQSRLDPAEVKARMMGRDTEGRNLIDGTDGNGFDYRDDAHGSKCPFQSHVRRANPRITSSRSRVDMPAMPRIIRRGMSYGPPPASDADADRGLVFMAYNASIAEQFEVIQSWLSGGNSSSPLSYSALRDPFLGVPQEHDPQTYEFKDGAGNSHRLNLESTRPLVKLQWGLYVFVPSIAALAELKSIADEAARITAADTTWARKRKDEKRAIRTSVLAQKGAAVIGQLRQIEQARGFDAAAAEWKIALEDISARTAGVSRMVWTAVRQLHGGALRTPYGILVCSRKLVMEVYDNRQRFYTVTGYAERMRKSFGEIYLGMDDGPQYVAEGAAVNQAIQEVSVDEAFASGFRHTAAIVDSLIRPLPADGEAAVDVKDLIDEVLARLSAEWFGVPDEVEVVSGGWHWGIEGAPTCPGHFHAPSRYMFQPNPGEDAADLGRRNGQALNQAVGRLVQSHRAAGTVPAARLGQAMFHAIADDDARLTRTLIGVMMGFLPTVDGNLRSALYEWVNDRSLWDHQLAYLADPRKSSLARAKRVLWPRLARTLQLRPVPELVWRTALSRHRLGPVDVEAGEKIVVGIVSATQESLDEETLDLFPAFGGDRSQALHPTHACPGYDMARGVMLGTLAALMQTARLRPTLSAMTLKLSRPSGA